MGSIHTLAAISAPIAILLVMVGVVVAVPVGVMAVIYLIVPFFKAIGWLIKQVGVFLFSTVADVLRLVGALITSLFLIPLTVGNIIIGRWSASAHYGRAIQAEVRNAGRSVYRLAVGNPARLLCLTSLTDGIERRIPEVMAAAPGPDRPSRRQGQFDGYDIVGSLPGGGSGSKLYVARPDEKKLAGFVRNGHVGVDRVVIKCFSQHDGTTLPQIVRENRALEAAKKLGLILEHDISNERFYYVMRYVPGDSLNLVTQRLHAAAGGTGLGRREMQEVLAYTADLLRTLHTYHDGGLWHKDVKPDNIIVADKQAHLVDFGLLTPLRSSMTLTTHGTEYFRDPEMVRMALKGVKVGEVDGAKFDLYAVGAVLFSMVENSFPAHGGLSQITRPCPEAVRWIVRRGMTDYDKRYQSAAAMLQDIEAVLGAADPYALRPGQLPSVSEQETEAPAAHASSVGAYPGAAHYGPVPPPLPPLPRAAHAGHRVEGWAGYPGMNPSVGPTGVASAARSTVTPRNGARINPDIRVTHWFSGRYHATDASARAGSPRGGVSAFAHVNAAAAAGAAAVAGAAQAARVVAEPHVHPGKRMPAQEQLRRARERAGAARQRVRNRGGARAQNFPAGVNAGIVLAVLVFVGVIALIVGSFLTSRQTITVNGATVSDVPTPVQHARSAIRVVTDTIATNARAAVKGARANVAAPAASHTLVSDDSRVLVVCEWSKFDQKSTNVVLDQIDRLNAAGFTVLGDSSPALEPDASTLDDQAETVAQLRSAVGTRIFLSVDARDAVRSWLDTSDTADLVVWFTSPNPGKPNDIPTAWLVGSSSIPSTTVSTARDLLGGAEEPAITAPGR